MNIEISLGILAGAFVVLVLFLIIGILDSRKTLKELNKTIHSAKKELDELSAESLKLIKNLNDLTGDAKKKLHALDFVFKPMAHAKEEIDYESRRLKNYDWTSEVMECLAAGAVVYNKIKGAIKEYAKHK